MTDLENLYRDKAKELGLIVNLTKDKDKGEEKAILFRPKPIDENKDKKPDDVITNIYIYLLKLNAIDLLTSKLRQ